MTEIIKIIKTPIVNDEYEDKEYPYYIKDFINTMNKYNLTKFYHNIKDINYIPTDDKGMVNKNAGAEYDVYSNSIHYNPDTININMTHELFHVSTRILTKDGVIVGFMQVKNSGIGIGLGLNEGYTQVMDERYFINYAKEKKYEVDYIYPTSKYICALLEYLLGKDRMEELFMNSDLLSLFKELSQYSSQRKTYNFLVRFDYLFMEADRNMHPNFLKVNKLYEDIIFYLAECFVTKFRMMYIAGELSSEDYDKCLEFVSYFMDQHLTYHKIFKSRKLSKYLPELQAKVNIKVNKSRTM